MWGDFFMVEYNSMEQENDIQKKEEDIVVKQQDFICPVDPAEALQCDSCQ